MGIASIWTGLGLRTSGPDHRAPWSSLTITIMNLVVKFVTGNEDRPLIKLIENLNIEVNSFVFFEMV